MFGVTGGRVGNASTESFAVAIRSKGIRLAAVALFGVELISVSAKHFFARRRGYTTTRADRLLRGERLYRDFFKFQRQVNFLTAGWFGLTNASLFSAARAGDLTPSSELLVYKRGQTILGGRRRHTLAAVRSGLNKPRPSFRADR